MKEVELNLLTPSHTPLLSDRCVRRVMEWVKSEELLQPSWWAVACKAIAICLSNLYLHTGVATLFAFSTTINSMQFIAARFKPNQNNLLGPRAYVWIFTKVLVVKTCGWREPKYLLERETSRLIQPVLAWCSGFAVCLSLWKTVFCEDSPLHADDW